jgi:hypothetical protein
LVTTASSMQPPLLYSAVPILPQLPSATADFSPTLAPALSVGAELAHAADTFRMKEQNDEKYSCQGAGLCVMSCIKVAKNRWT